MFKAENSRHTNTKNKVKRVLKKYRFAAGILKISLAKQRGDRK